MQQLATLLLVTMVTVTSLASGHAMPIWELLPRQEKMGELMYVFMDQVDQACSFSYIPDCQHVLALNGLTNLVNMDELTLNRLDPYQSGARQVIWAQVMRGGFDLPPAYLPYYLLAEADEMTNEIDEDYPSPSRQPASPPFLYPYSPIPNAHNKPTATVSDPHPYAVHVAPPTGFTAPLHSPSSPRDRDHELQETGSEGRAEVAPEERFAGWSDSETLVANQQATNYSSAPGSESGATEGNQQPLEDIYASWSDSEAIVSDQLSPDDRFATWSDMSTPLDDQQPAGDAYVAWRDDDVVAGNLESLEDRFAGWNDSDGTPGNQEPVEDVYVTWSDVEVTEGNQQSPKAKYAGWSVSGSAEDSTQGKHATWRGSETKDSKTKRKEQTGTDRYAFWSDSEAGLSDREEYRMPAGIKPSADFEPVMVESRVVLSRVPPPGHSVSEVTATTTRTKRAVGTLPSLSFLPFPLLRQ